MARRAHRRPHSVLLTDGNEVCDYLQCPHCGNHIEWTTEQQRKSGWCFECASITCGYPRCRSCVHHEKKLDLVEQGKMSIEEL